MELNERQMLSLCSSCVCSFVAALAHWPVKVKPALMTLRYAKIIPQGAKSFLLFLLMQHSPTEEKKQTSTAAADVAAAAVAAAGSSFLNLSFPRVTPSFFLSCSSSNHRNYFPSVAVIMKPLSGLWEVTKRGRPG